MSEVKKMPPEPSQDVQSLLEQGLRLHEQGELEVAQELFRRVLSLDPDHFTAMHQLGVIQNQWRDFEGAASLLGAALKLRPKSALAHFNLGIALWNLGRVEEAFSHTQYSLIINPDNPEALLNSAILLRQLNRPEEALVRWDKLIAAKEHVSEAHFHRSRLLEEMGRFEEALVSLDQLLAANPEWTEALMLRGNVWLTLGNPAEAIKNFDRVLALEPSHGGALLNRGNALLRLGRPDAALDDYDRVIALDPANGVALGNRSVALNDLNRPLEALASCERALGLDPEDANAHGNKGAALLNLRRNEEALESLQRAAALNSRNADVFVNQGAALHNLGRHVEAIASYRRALDLNPHMAVAHSNLIFLLDYIPELGFAELQEARKVFNATQVGKAPFPKISYPHERSASRRLVLGYVSADFRNHSAASCFGPVLRHHHKADFKIICYSGVQVEDDWTAQFRQLADAWRDTRSLSDEELAEQIRADQVDILIDLSGHSAGNRLMVFARKPAPIQVTAWGHGGGTGLPAMDYQFSDPVMVPSWARGLFAEASYDLPCSLPFEPLDLSPPVLVLPALSKGFVTFGSLNKFAKVTPSALTLWARILARVPGSRLLLKDGPFGLEEEKSRILALMAQSGIGPERVDLRGHTSHIEHLMAYHEVDIALDTFPQNGGLSTWEALWMGAPVITKLGNQPSSRLSGGILHALGLDAWIREDEEAYLEWAVEKALEIEGLALFRRDIRERIATSSAGNPERYTQAVEQGYREMWKRWLST